MAYSELILIQKLEQYFKPAKHWENCTMPMSSDEFFTKIEEFLPNHFDSRDQLVKILRELGYKHSHNEHNNKYYWLVNPV